MTANKTLTGIKALVLCLATVMAITILAPSPAEASSSSRLSHNPCPNFHVDDVFADPHGDWDYDHVSNSDELYGGTSPCVRDTNGRLCKHYRKHCDKPSKGYPARGSNYNHKAVTRTSACDRWGGWNWRYVLADPHGDWDKDGVSNQHEAINNSNPCRANRTNPCPHWNASHMRAMPHHDWDGDGVTNHNEVYRGTNPCVSNAAKRLPHVDAPAPAPRTQCPAGYPYYHPHNGLCYANPIGGW